MADNDWLSAVLTEDIETPQAEPAFAFDTYPEERISGRSILPEYTPAEPEWGFDVYERVSKSAQESFGAIWGGLGAVSDQIGMEGARDWALDRSNELFEEAGQHDIVSTQFAEISNPIDLAKFTSEKVIEYLPDLVLMFAGGAGVGTAATKVAGTTVGKSAAKTLARKSLDRNLKTIAKQTGKDLSDKAVQQAAYKATLKQMGQLAGMASFEGFQGTGQMYSKDVMLRGVEEASPLAAGIAGAGQAAVAMVSPFNRALASMAVGKGVKSVASMTIGEATEEVIQGGIEKLHEAGIDPYLTVGEIFSDPKTYMELAEAGFVGAIVGGAYGGAGRVVFGKEGDEASNIVSPEDTTLVEESPAPILSAHEQRVAQFEKDLVSYQEGIEIPGAPTGVLPEVPTKTTEELLAEYEPTVPVGVEEGRRVALEREVEAYQPEVPVTPATQQEAIEEQEARKFEEKAKAETHKAWFNRFAPETIRRKEVTAEIKRQMDEVEKDTNNLPTNLVERKKAVEERDKKVEAIIEEVETAPTEQELTEATRKVDVAEAMANVEAAAGVELGEKGVELITAKPPTAVEAEEVIKEAEPTTAIPETTDPDLKLILDNDIDGLVEKIKGFKNPSAAFTEIAEKAGRFVEENPQAEEQILSVLKAAYVPATKREGAAPTGAYTWTVEEGIAETTHPATGEVYRVMDMGEGKFAIMDSAFEQVTPETYKTSITARKALETIVPIAEEVKKAEKVKAKAKKKAVQAKKKPVKAIRRRVPKAEKKGKILKGKTLITSEDGRAYILEDLAEGVFKAGQSLRQFADKLRKTLGKAYTKIAGKVKKLYKQLNAHLEKVTTGAEVGAIGDIVKPVKEKAKEVKEEPVTPTIEKVKKTTLEKKEETIKKDLAYAKKNEIEIGGVWTKFKEWWVKADKLRVKAFKTSSEVLREVSPRILNRMRKFEFKTQRIVLEQRRAVESFIKNVEALPNDVEFVLSKALMNGEVAIRDKILKEHNLEKDFEKVKDVLTNIEKRGDKVGLIPNKIKNYFPRSVRNVDGLVTHYSEKPEEYGFVEHELNVARKEAKKRGKELSPADENKIITDLLMTGHYGNIPRPGASRDRNVDYVTRELVQYYYSIGETLTRHISEMNEKIEAREMLGKSKQAEKTKNLEKIVKNIEKLSDNTKRTEEENKKLDDFVLQYEVLYSEIKDLDKELTDSISDFIRTDVKGKGAEIAIDLIRSRLQHQGVSGAVGPVRDLAYALALGSPTSAITQIGDLTWSIYRNNPVNTMKGAARAIRGMIDKKFIAKDDFDFTGALKELGSTNSSKMLDTVLTWTGLKGMDIFAKETAMQATLEKWKQKDSRAEFIKDHTDMFGGKVEAAKVWVDIKNGKKTENVLFALFNDLSNWQPISLSEMPQAYLTAGNMRVIYMLKTFAIKALNSIHREVSTDWKKGNKVGAAKKLVGLVAILSLSGAAADELKDFLLGKDTDLADNVVDNIVQLMLLNKYSMVSGLQKDNFITSVVNGMVPPMRFADDIVADLYAAASTEKDFKFKTLKDVPVVGRILWSHSEWGEAAELATRKRNVYDTIRGTATGGTTNREMREAVREFNKGAREYNIGKIGDNRIKPITSTNIKNLKRRERKKEKE